MKNNRRLAAVLAVIMAFWLGGHTVAMAAAIPMPILPYIPPTKVELYDLLNNAFGITRLDIEDDVKRLAAYIDLYVRIMGAANADIIDKMIDGSQSSYKYKIKADLMNGVQSVMREQITTGYELVGNEAITGTTTINAADAQRICDALANMNVQQTVAELQQRYSQAAAAIGGGLSVCVWVTREGSQTAVFQGFYKAQYTASWRSSKPYGYTVQGDTYLYQSGIGIKYNNAYGQAGTSNGKYALTSGNFWGTHILHVNFGKVSEFKKATAQSNAITTALQNSDDIPITADSEITNGTLDRTKDVIITIPATIPTPAQGVTDLPQVQEDLGVLPLPLTQDVAQTVTDLRELAQAKYGDAMEYTLDLRDYFPFCLPFDIGNLLACFIAEPQAPSFEWEFPTGYDATNHEFTMQTFTIDLSMWDNVAYWLRKGELAIFIVGLAAVTRQWFLRG